jgi:hypothetical protein
VHQVKARIDQRAIEIEDHQLDTARVWIMHFQDK